jgi:hypothetical protein
VEIKSVWKRYGNEKYKIRNVVQVQTMPPWMSPFSVISLHDKEYKKFYLQFKYCNFVATTCHFFIFKNHLEINEVEID